MQVAIDQRTKGDEYHIAAATQWIGRILADCFPERFIEATPPITPPMNDERDSDGISE